MTRLKKIIELTNNYSENRTSFYDLFCDHGHVGASLMKAGRVVYFNDKREHLIAAIEAEHTHSNNKSEYIVQEAEKLSLKEGAFVIMAGVGGLLMIDCLRAWSESHDKKIMESLVFLTCPTYYDSELRHYLRECGFLVLQELLCKDRGRIYDIQVISLRCSLRRVSLIPCQNNRSLYLEFSQRKLRNLMDKRDKSEQDLILIEKYKK